MLKKFTKKYSFKNGRLLTYRKVKGNMHYIVSDFYMKFSDKMTLLCGKEGLKKRISSIEVLDYEFVPQLRGKYKHSNFKENEIVIATFLYARENPHFINDAIKELISKGCSALVIKNVFNLPITQSILRYAEAKNFPIFNIESKDFHFDEAIYEVMDGVRRNESATEVKKQLDRIIRGHLDEIEMKEATDRLCPSIENQHQAIFIQIDGDNIDNLIIEYTDRYHKSDLDIPQAFLTFYDNGLIYLYSWSETPSFKLENIIDVLVKDILKKEEIPAMGISRVHYYVGEINHSIGEAMEAAFLTESGVKRYEELGTLRVIIPFCEDRVMIEYSDEILEPIIEYDLANKAFLLKTLVGFCENQFSFIKTAKALSQHENTVRYRMDQIAEITGLNYRNLYDLNQLDMAYKIRKCRNLNLHK